MKVKFFFLIIILLASNFIFANEEFDVMLKQAQDGKK